MFRCYSSPESLGRHGVNVRSPDWELWGFKLTGSCEIYLWLSGSSSLPSVLSRVSSFPEHGPVADLVIGRLFYVSRLYGVSRCCERQFFVQRLHRNGVCATMQVPSHVTFLLNQMRSIEFPVLPLPASSTHVILEPFRSSRSAQHLGILMLR